MVWNARKAKDYEHIDYWLHTIEAFGENSPVILVMSKWGERDDDLNMKDLRERFPNIVGACKIDSKDGKGSEELKQIICEQSWKLPHMQTAWLPSWLKVRKILESDDRNWIDYAEFETICKSQGLDKNQIDILDGYLHDLGVIIHFRDTMELKNMVILKPEWATDAVYQILDTKSVRKRGGVLLHCELEDIWDIDTYSVDIHHKLLELMEQFQLSYELPDNKSHLVAELLPSTELDFDWDENNNLIFYYRYDFLPSGVMPRFIVGTHLDLSKNGKGESLQWREGAVLQREGARAFVKARRLEKIIEIKIGGHNNKKLELLAIIRNRFYHINKSIKNIKIDQEIPCNCKDDCTNVYNYYELMNGERKGETDVKCTKSWKMVSFSSLLDGYEKKEDRLVGMKTKKADSGEKAANYYDLSTNFNAPVDRSNISTHSDNIEQKVELPGELVELLSKMVDTLKADLLLKDEERKELLADVENLRLELYKKPPRKKFVELYLSSLGSVASLVSLADKIVPFLPVLYLLK